MGTGFFLDMLQEKKSVLFTVWEKNVEKSCGQLNQLVGIG